MNNPFGECHGHIALDGKDYKTQKTLHENTPNEEFVRSVLRAYQTANIQFFRDGGDKWNVSRLAKIIAPEYDVDYRTPVFAIYKNGSYGSILGKGYDTMKEYVSLVNDVQAGYGDFIKIMASGIMDFNQYGKISECTLKNKELKEMIHIAKDYGYSVMVHVNGDSAIQAALEAGADTIEHGYYMKEETLDLFKETKAVWVPTLTPVSNLLGNEGFDGSVINKIFENSKSNIQKAFDMDINIGLGSDAGSYAVPHVSGTEKEYELLLDVIKDKNRLDYVLTKSETLIKIKFVRV